MKKLLLFFGDIILVTKLKISLAYNDFFFERRNKTVSFKENEYTQKKCQKFLRKGYDIVVSGKEKPQINQITIPFEIFAFSNNQIIGYLIIKKGKKTETLKQILLKKQISLHCEM